MRCYMKCLIPLLLMLTLGCQSASKHLAGRELTESQALALAVELANNECEAKYSFAPFSTSSYLIEFRDGRWQWGSLDPAGESGFSAVVSFGPRGEDRHIEIYLSTDKILPPSAESDRQD